MTLAIPLEQADDGFAVGREIGGASVHKHRNPILGQETRPDELDDRVEPLRRPLEPPAPEHDREGAVRQWSGLEAGAASKSRSTRDARRRLRRVGLRRKMCDRLRDAVFLDREVCLPQIGDRVAVAVNRPHVNRHEHDTAANRTRNLCRRRLLRKDQRREQHGDKTGGLHHPRSS